MTLLRDSNGYLVSVQLHYVRTEGSAGLFLALGYDVSAVVDYPPLAVATDDTVVSRSFYKVVLLDHVGIGLSAWRGICFVFLVQ